MRAIWVAVVSAVASVIVALITSGALTADLRGRVASLDALPVGSIAASMLKETQFNDLSEGSWVLADGRVVSGTDYARMTGSENVPDLRGEFLRGLDTDGRVDPDGRARALGAVQESALLSHSHLEQRLSVSGNYYQHAASNQNVAGHGSSMTPLYEHVQTSNATDLNGAALPNSRETRPTNVAVNYFVKVRSRK
jgi:hypothetical protein